MIDQKGFLVCEQTGMELSPLMSSHMKKYFNENKSVPYPAEANPSNEASWFCPGCGVKMDVSDGSVTCPECHRSLNPFIRQLTELYFHLPLKNA